MGGLAFGVGVVYLELVISYVLSIFLICVILCIYSNVMLCVWHVLSIYFA